MKKSRLARKAERLTRTPIESAYATESNRIRARRDAALAKVNEEFRAEIKRLEDARQESRGAIWEQYDAEREANIKAFAKQEAEAA